MDATQTRQETTTTNLEQLNDDCLLRIFDYLHFDDKIRLKRTSSRFRRLLDWQLDKTRALRLGHFLEGGYIVTSGLLMNTCSHHQAHHRRQTGTLCNGSLLTRPADQESQCHELRRFDYLHRALKVCSHNITMLSLGRLQISYRLLLVLTHNLPHLEHLELVACASSTGTGKGFETSPMFNQHLDEQVNMEQRLVRARLVRDCQLIQEARQHQHWPRLHHLLVQQCNLLNEFSLMLIVSLTSHSLTHMTVESNQYLTGEFLNYCGPQLKILKLKNCPSLQPRFLEDLMKIKRLLEPASEPTLTPLNPAKTASARLQAPHAMQTTLNTLTNFHHHNQGIVLESNAV